MRKINQQSDPWDPSEGQIRRQQRRELKNAGVRIFACNPRGVCTEPRAVVTPQMPRTGLDRHRGDAVIRSAWSDCWPSMVYRSLDTA
jgi:hypothetical protein